MGGADKFYGNFYINSPFPLAIVRKAKDDNFLNANYYDDSRLFDCVKEFMIDSLKRHFNMGLDTDEVFVLGVKNGSFIKKLNDNHRFFKKMTILEHPRFIQQYKSKEKQLFIDKYIEALKGEESATKKRE
ncbi:MAG: SMUG2 DNA glycosylase family protein [Saprospiraceae bacterium]|nr:SMUG2 DNA glycosylase family protein [Saprospiraceae bacterium]